MVVCTCRHARFYCCESLVAGREGGVTAVPDMMPRLDWGIYEDFGWREIYIYKPLIY
jgi:hypothetical protein